ncbi:MULTISPECIES: alanine racemase [unclassified Brevibacterium]|uniref:alanine racemase n=1 Tax=unclassified Brevibacterium TaxID=2614124 RepID=UPI0008C05F77|nr:MULTISPECIES: alanine racemase [unclassified Brevibacterium]OFL68899.1 hypothetical protein HMPREF2757_06830 [Brevibacterium sp. HMSC063G07]
MSPSSSQLLPTTAYGPSLLTAHIDRDAIRTNLAVLREHAGEAGVIPVVKADAYGHGITGVVPVLVEAGIRRIGTATVPEALQVRDLLERLAAEGLTGAEDTAVLCWLMPIGVDFAQLAEKNIEVGISAAEQLPHLAQAARQCTDNPLRIHIKIDSGLGRGGMTEHQLDGFLREVAQMDDGVRAGLRIVGAMTHLAVADEPGSEFTDHQYSIFTEEIAKLRGFLLSQPELGEEDELIVHASNSPAALTIGTGPDTLTARAVRTGLAVYGLSPFAGSSPESLGLRPAMTLKSQVVALKDVARGSHASYGLTYTCEADTRFALVAGGYADGLPRSASNAARVFIGGRQYRQVGRIAMDQIVVEVGLDSDVGVGDEVIIFGPGEFGEPTAADWGAWGGTINYEIVTGIGSRVERIMTGRAVGDSGAEAGDADESGELA